MKLVFKHKRKKKERNIIRAIYLFKIEAKETYAAFISETVYIVMS